MAYSRLGAFSRTENQRSVIVTSALRKYNPADFLVQVSDTFVCICFLLNDTTTGG